jgi:hypothetical protein
MFLQKTAANENVQSKKALKLLPRCGYNNLDKALYLYNYEGTEMR